MIFDPTKPVTVYILTNTVNGRQYVGITTDFLARLRRHRHHSSGCRAIRSAIVKYGWESFLVEKIAVLPLSEAGELECNLIAVLKTLAPSGYNLSTGGEIVSGYKWTDEAISRLSASRKGRKITPYHRTLLARYNGTRAWTAETREKLREGRLGKRHSIESCAKISSAKRGKAAWGTRIDICGVEYPHMKAAAESLGVHKATISYRAKQGWEGYRIIGRFPIGGNNVS